MRGRGMDPDPGSACAEKTTWIMEGVTGLPTRATPPACCSATSICKPHGRLHGNTLYCDRTDLTCKQASTQHADFF